MSHRNYPFSPGFLKQIIASLNEGVILIDESQQVVFSNMAAGSLFGLTDDAMLDLDTDDIIALCYEGRLDRDSFASDLRSRNLPVDPVKTYELATAEKRLIATPFLIYENDRQIAAILISERTSWRNDLIAQTVMEQLHSPITMASSYSNILINRLQDRSIDSKELTHLVSIISNSLAHSLETWGQLARLRSTDPEIEQHWPMFPTNLPAVIYSCVNAVSDQVTTRITIEMASDLPEIAGNEQYLQTAFTSILSELTSRLSHRSQIVIRAAQEKTYAQVFLFVRDGAQQPVRSYLFEELPFAMAEEIIKRHEGRIWLKISADGTAVITITLPLWGSGS